MIDAAAVIDRLGGRRIAVVGDVMLDHFLIGRVDRISPEAPVPVVRFDRDAFRLGGAANVAANVQSLDGVAHLVGCVGDDDAAERLRAALQAQAIARADLIVDPSRPTVRKVRIVTTRNQQVARVDYEQDTEFDEPTASAVSDAAVAASAGSHAIVLSDYRKGVVTQRLIAAVCAAAGTSPVIVDPKIPDAARYRGVTLLTPNHHEAELMSGTRIRTTDDARTAARHLHDATGANVLITWGEHGMWLFDASTSAAVERAIPATAREVSDVTGAGDTVVATLALALAGGASLSEAAHLANLSAGIVVAKFGAATVSRAELRGAV